jgi:tRNA (adenine37-N6)-methyltransferase
MGPVFSYRNARDFHASPLRIQALYWIHRVRRDLVLQTPFQRLTMGTFALRSSVRPNPIASSIVALLAVKGTTLRVRGLEGTSLLDLKPEHGAHESI